MVYHMWPDRKSPVARAVTCIPAHVPNMVRHGSRSSREIVKAASVLDH
jgi:hypothetical protein